jgi:hypothetical protein
MITGSLGMSADFQVGVHTTHNRGLTPEELAKQCAEKIVSVSDTAPEPIRAQAHAFREQVEHLVAIYLKQAVQSDRTTVYNAIRDAGHPELAEALKGL